jgi:polysaccharide export outer membrane protein
MSQIRPLPARLRRPIRLVGTASCAVAIALAAGCETDSWFDPSRTGYFEHTPTSIPVLSRLDVIEKPPSAFPILSAPTNEDLEPGDLEYRLAAGDQVRVEVFELVAQGQTDFAIRLVDPSGNIRLPTIGEVPAAGLTIAQLQEEIEDRLRGLINDPIVNIVLERGQGFSFTVSGAISQPGVYGLTRPDFRLIEALALAGGPFLIAEQVLVIRSQPLEDKFRPRYDERGFRGSGVGGQRDPDAPVDIEDLINRLEQQPPSPGAVRGMQEERSAPPIDIDDLSAPTRAPAPMRPAQEGTGWRWDAAAQRWVDSGGAPGSGPARPRSTAPATGQMPAFATRVLSIDYPTLVKGDANLNVVIRPGDQIYVVPPPSGVVYIDGEIIRPGVYELPQRGDLTLSRLVAAAGGLGQLAIPSRVDLVRKIEPGREAVVRVNLGAIRNRAEPDIILKADDHIIIGTNFFAYPLAVIRNGFRMTYGFGFLLDRNFGNDVFGAPPTNVLGE